MANYVFFSFYTDAGQFGAAQAHVALIAILLMINAPNQKYRILWLTIAILNLWGYAISGTRGALAVINGRSCFIHNSQQKRKSNCYWSFCFIFVIWIFKVLQQLEMVIYQINRIRTGLSSDDPSLQLRLQNQRTLAAIFRIKTFWCRRLVIPDQKHENLFLIHIWQQLQLIVGM